MEDAALILDIIAGYDPMDPATVETPVREYTRALSTPAAKLRLGVTTKAQAVSPGRVSPCVVSENDLPRSNFDAKTLISSAT